MPAKHLNVARKLRLKFIVISYFDLENMLTSKKCLFYHKKALKSVYMDLYRPLDVLLVSNVARKAKRVAHPCSKP